jgi:hypothetical protein
MDNLSSRFGISTVLICHCASVPLNRWLSQIDPQGFPEQAIFFLPCFGKAGENPLAVCKVRGSYA